MTSARVVETSVDVISNSPSQDYTHPDYRTLLNYEVMKCRWKITQLLSQHNFNFW